MGNLTPNFGAGLKRARKKAGYKTQQDFADSFYKSLETIRNWEQGKTKPSLDDFLDLCYRFECDADYLLGTIDERTHNISFICQYTGLSETAVEHLHMLSAVNNNERYRQIICAINRLLEPEIDSFQNHPVNDYLGDNVLWYISEYLNDRITGLALPDYENDDNHKRLSNTVLLLANGTPVIDFNVRDMKAVFLHLLQSTLDEMRGNSKVKGARKNGKKSK